MSVSTSSFMTYGLEAWTLTKSLERELRSGRRRMERSLLGVTTVDKKTAMDKKGD